MVKRQFTDEERKFTEKALERVKLEKEYWDAMRRQTSLSIEIAPVVFKKQVSDLKNKLVEIEQLREQQNFTITTTEDQLLNGVEDRSNE